MEQYNLTILERFLGLLVMAILFIPLWILCYIAYADIMMIYTGFTDSSLIMPFYIFIIIMLFWFVIGCIVIPLAFIGIMTWLSLVYAFITNKEPSFDIITNLSNHINTFFNKASLPKLPNYYYRTVKFFGKDQQRHAEENINKAEDYQEKLNTLTNQIHDSDLQSQLYKMQLLSTNMLKYLKSNPDKVILARQFTDYYLNEAANFVEHYVELEKSKLNTSEIITAKENIKNTLNKFDDAYKQQFSKLIEDKLIDINAEIIIARKMLEEIGIYRRNRREDE